MDRVTPQTKQGTDLAQKEPQKITQLKRGGA